MKTRMFRTVAVVLGVAAMTTSASAVTYDWTNADADNDFSNLNNWLSQADGTSHPTAFTDVDDYWINLSGAVGAELSTTLGGIPDDLRVGENLTGELRVSGGINSLDNTFRVGRGSGTGILDISDGTLNVLNTFSTFADGGTELNEATATVTMTGGTLNADRQTWAQRVGDTATLNMSGGTINIDYFDPTPPSTSASLRVGAGDATLTLSGSAVINTRKFYINEGGLLVINGGTINITGRDLSDINPGDDGTPGNVDDFENPTFNFTEADIASMLGRIEYNSGDFNVTDDWESLFDTAIAHGNIYTTVLNMHVDATYSASTNLTTLVLVPEPASIGLLGLGAVALLRRRRNA